MTVQVDKTGRILLAKSVRDRLGIQLGDELEIEEMPGGVLLKVRPASPALIKRDGLPVYAGNIPHGFDAHHAIEVDRDERAAV